MSLYPPGCSGPPEFPEDCAVCGVANLDDCVCPCCPVCEVQGDPRCYDVHGLVRSQKQVDMFRARMEAEEQQAKGEAEWLAKHVEEEQRYYDDLEKDLRDGVL